MSIKPKAKNLGYPFSWIPLAFLLCFIYWFYLASTCEMVIAHDAIGYEQLGLTLYNKGWLEYFKIGPNREPLYPCLISISMGIAQKLSVSYRSIEMLIQISLLLLTRILTLVLLKKLKVNHLLCALTILYLGVSPALLNSTLILYSEIATYPFILSIILLSCQCLQNITGNRLKLIFWSVSLGLTLLATTFLPLCLTFVFSFQSIRFDLSGLSASFCGLENYTAIFKDSQFWQALFNTFYFLLVAVPVEMILGFSLAVLLNHEFRMLSWVRALLLITVMLSPVVVAVIWRMLFNPQSGWVNYCLHFLNIEGHAWLGSPLLAMPALILTDVWHCTPYCMLL